MYIHQWFFLKLGHIPTHICSVVCVHVCVLHPQTLAALCLFLKSVFTIEDISTVPDFPTKVDTLLNDIYFTYIMF